MRKRILTAVLAFAVAVTILAGFSSIAVAKTYPTDVSVASKGNVLLGVKGWFNSAEDSAAALSQVNKYRKANGVPAVKWSNDVERAGRIYAAEAAVSHNSVRPCGKPYDIAFNGVDCIPIGLTCFNTYADLKGTVVEYYGEDPGHPLFTSKNVKCFACASFLADDGYTPALMLFYSTDQAGSTAYETTSECVQTLEFQKSQVGKAKLSGSAQVKKGKKATYTLSVPVTLKDYYGNKSTLKTTCVGTTKWKSSKPSVASISSKGKLTAKKNGTVTITATNSATGFKATKKVVVRLGKQPLKVSPSNKTLDSSRVARAKYSYKLKVKGAKGKLTYSVDSFAKKAGVKVSKKGKVTVPKGWNGMATIKVKAAKTSKYFATTKTVHVYCW